jgi:hypothetical protein
MRDLLLTPFSWLYGAGIRLRRFFYERGVFASVKLGVKTISVGNITVAEPEKLLLYIILPPICWIEAKGSAF